MLCPYFLSFFFPRFLLLLSFIFIMLFSSSFSSSRMLAEFCKSKTCLVAQWSIVLNLLRDSSNLSPSQQNPNSGIPHYQINHFGTHLTKSPPERFWIDSTCKSYGALRSVVLEASSYVPQYFWDATEMSERAPSFQEDLLETFSSSFSKLKEHWLHHLLWANLRHVVWESVQIWLMWGSVSQLLQQTVATATRTCWWFVNSTTWSIVLLSFPELWTLQLPKKFCFG